MNSDPFGRRLRFFRRSAQDPVHGGPLSQDRLADLLAAASGIVYSRAAVSDWERGKGHIHKDDRTVLVNLIGVLHRHGGLPGVEAANDWLALGNYRRLNEEEKRAVSAEWLASATPAEPATAVFTAPALPPHAVVGRDDDLASLKARLFDGRNLALSAINGLPGVGKTTLAVLLAHDPDVQSAFPDGVLWVGLGRNPDSYHLLGQWARAVAIPQAELDRMGAIKLRANAVHDVLRSKRMLLVIDDVWNAAPIPLFSLGGPDCVHVLTTRQPPIAVAFAGAATVRVAELSEAHALDLLNRLAPQAVAQEPEAAREVVRATGGLPLALVLIGNHLRMEAASGRRRRVRAALDGLRSAENRFQIARTQSILTHEAHPSLTDEQPISLRTLIGISDEALSPRARGVLRALALFPPKPNSFSEEAALAVAQTDAADIVALLDALDELTDHGLLETTGRERYTLHQSISDFARLDPPDPLQQAQMAIYYAQFAAANGDDHAALDQEMDNIVAALDAVDAADRPDLLWALLDAAFPFLDIKGHYDLAHARLERLAARADLLPGARAGIQQHLGLIAYKRGDSASATTYWEHGLTLAQQADAHDAALTLLSYLSMVTSQAREDERARRYLQQAVTHARAAENWLELSRALGNIGRTAYINDRYADAEPMLAEAYAVAVAHDLSALACGIANLRGLTAMALGDVDAAHSHYFDGLRIARAERYEGRTLDLLTNLGHTLREAGHIDDATLYLEEALVLARRFDDRAKEGHILMDLGLAASARGDSAEAMGMLAEAYALAAAIENTWLRGLIHARWGEAAFAAQQSQAAAQHFADALTFGREASNNREILGLAHFGLARLAHAAGASAECQAHLAAAADALGASGHMLTKRIAAWTTHHGA